MEHEIARKYNVKLEVMTKTHIWSGDILLKDVDLIIYREGKRFDAHLIDLHKLVKIIMEKNGYNDLKKAIQDKNILPLLRKYQILFKDVEYSVYPSMFAPNAVGKTIKRHLTINGKPSIPGSEVKGLIRTAILNYMISKGIINTKTINEALNNLQYTRKVKNIDSFIQSFMKQIIKSNTSVDLLRYVGVSDPLTYSVKPVLDKFVAYKVTGGEEIASEDLIVLDTNSIFEYELQLYKPIPESMVKGGIGENYAKLNKLYSQLIADNELKLLDALREFSVKLLDFERDQLSKIARMNKSVDVSDMLNRLEHWRREVEASKNVFYLKIGYGAGMASKTIYLSMSNDHRRRLVDIMSNIVRGRSRGRIHVWDTLSVKIVGSELYDNKRIVPVGWVKIEVV